MRAVAKKKLLEDCKIDDKLVVRIACIEFPDPTVLRCWTGKYMLIRESMYHAKNTLASYLLKIHHVMFTDYCRVPPPFRIVDHFSKCIYVVFAMYLLGIVYILEALNCKNYIYIYIYLSK